MTTFVPLILAAMILPYLWGELTYRVLHWVAPLDLEQRARKEPGRAGEVLDFQI